MMKKSYVFCILLICLILIVGCNQYGKSDANVADSLQIPFVKTLHEECMELVGNDYKDTCYIEDITCDEEGRTMIDKVYYGEGSSCTIEFWYEAGRLIRKDCGFVGQDPASIYYNYDTEGVLTSVSDSEHPMPIETYLYDEAGRKEWTYVHDGESDSILCSYHTQYDVQGRVMEEIQYGVEYEQQVLETHTYSYDNKGNLEAEKIENVDGFTTVTYDYTEFDEWDSWTLCFKMEYQMPSGIGKKTRTTRKLTYY